MGCIFFFFKENNFSNYVIKFSLVLVMKNFDCHPEALVRLCCGQPHHMGWSVRLDKSVKNEKAI